MLKEFLEGNAFEAFAFQMPLEKAEPRSAGLAEEVELLARKGQAGCAQPVLRTRAPTFMELLLLHGIAALSRNSPRGHRQWGTSGLSRMSEVLVRQ